MSNRVVVDIKDHVASVRLNRPEKQNALDWAMFEQLSEAGRSLKANREVRAVVLHAEGENFCAGIDTSVFATGGIEMDMFKPQDDSNANFFQHPAYVWRELDVPVICAIDGNCFGGGLQIALGADIRIASPRARLSVMEIRWGLIPDLGLSATLRNVMPIDRVKELTFTGRIVDGEEAGSLGLVTQVSDSPLDAAMALAESIAASSPDAIQTAKSLLNDCWALSDAETLQLEAELQLKIMAAPNQAEAVRAQMERRPPKFSDAKG
ncbi:MAG: crotonase/enoyl-CoA hydratase family protein [Woeseiaceae bacterium]|nr:crotonase/enoyl-CoA hydratase family protein [Woeseiaceae bacterium]